MVVVGVKDGGKSVVVVVEGNVLLMVVISFERCGGDGER